MRLQVFKTLWGHSGSLEVAVAECLGARFGGLEGVPPPDPATRRELRRRLDDAGLDYVAEVCTGGGYVPRREATAAEHLASLRAGLDRAAECRPLFITAVAGCDAWSLSESVDFFGAAHSLAAERGATVSFETHRGRSLFNPWVTRDVLLRLPELRLTCDFSHWCVVCERLLDTEADVLQLCADRTHHVHARVGYDQGPQVPDPAAPEYGTALEAHERWWTLIWESRRRRGLSAVTMTPEFGPDGYLHQLPYTGMPVADLWQINRWVGERQRRRFEAWLAGPASPEDTGAA